MLLETDYPGHRIEVDAVRAGDRWDADVRIRHILSDEKPRVERVT